MTTNILKFAFSHSTYNPDECIVSYAIAQTTLRNEDLVQTDSMEMTLDQAEALLLVFMNTVRALKQ